MSLITNDSAKMGKFAFAVFVVACMVIEGIEVFEQIMVYIALPTIMTDLHLDPVQGGWIISAFLLGGAGAASIGGALGDRYGRKSVLVLTLVLAALGSLLALSGTYPAIVAGRAIQGASVAGMGLLVGIIRETIADSKRMNYAIAMATGAAALAGGGAAYVSGLIVDHSGWRMIFAAGLAAGIAGILAAIFLIPRGSKPPASASRIDWLGAILLAPALAAVLYGADNLRSLSLTDPKVWANILGGSALFAVWLVHELRTPDPLINMRLLKDRPIAIAMLAISIAGIGTIGAGAVLMPLIQMGPKNFPVGLGLSAAAAGSISLLFVAGSFVGNFIIGWISTRFGSRTLLITGFGVSTMFWGLMFLTYDNLVLFTACGVIASALGTVSIIIAVTTISGTAVPEEASSQVVGFNQTLRSLTSAIGTAVAGTILASSTVADTPFPKQDSTFWTLGFIVVIMAIGCGTVFLLPRRGKSEDEDVKQAEVVASA
ncbi:MFS transporter [Streptomyces sp. NPDC002143]